MADCAFCRIVAGDSPAFVVADDERTVAFLDQGQATDGHTLVVPRTHADDIWAISDDDAAAVMRMVKRVAHLLDERLSPDGLNVVQSNRAAGWQEIRHLHVHVVPRWAGDGLTPPWGPSHPSPDRLATVWRRLQEPPGTPGSGTASAWPR
ncbi:MAG: HIT family protein [Ilumatobacteraceae bacterium]|nr:HIT family protein [Ilumatobacteraceae bacterium]